MIRRYNEWAREIAVSGQVDRMEGLRVLVLVDYGRQTWADVDGGSGWREELDKIEQLVRERLDGERRQ